MLGEGIKLGEFMGMANRMLVGRVRGRNYSLVHFKKWVVEVWGLVLHVLPLVANMTIGSYSISQTQHILSGFSRNSGI